MAVVVVVAIVLAVAVVIAMVVAVAVVIVMVTVVRRHQHTPVAPPPRLASPP